MLTSRQRSLASCKHCFFWWMVQHLSPEALLVFHGPCDHCQPTHKATQCWLHQWQMARGLRRWKTEGACCPALLGNPSQRQDCLPRRLTEAVASGAKLVQGRSTCLQPLPFLLVPLPRL